jgi:4-amino-4-deoxy-L-arabinose transferase-like glycosyltransferase
VIDHLLEAVLTAVCLTAGYMLAAVVVLAVTPKQERLPDRLASAAVALTLLFAACVAFYVWTEYRLDVYPEFIIEHGEATSGAPTWLRAANGAAENMLSEVFQVWMAAYYFKHRPWPGSPESEG